MEQGGTKQGQQLAEELLTIFLSLASWTSLDQSDAFLKINKHKHDNKNTLHLFIATYNDYVARHAEAEEQMRLTLTKTARDAMAIRLLCVLVVLLVSKVSPR